MARLLSLILCLLVAACAHHPATPAAPHLLHDALFAAPTQTIITDAIFAMSDEMRDYARTEFGTLRERDDPRKALLEALYKRRLRLSYDAETTRNAAQAFEAKAGNCLSLVIMTAAFAKHLKLPYSFQTVQADLLYSRSADLTLASGHVNLVLARLSQRARFQASKGDDLLVDFLPADEVRGQLARDLDEQTIVAMYLNNRAAEELAAGRLDAAYHWARAAVLQDPGFAAALNTLSVIYLRRGHLQEAEAALRHLLSLDSNYTAAWSNLALVLRRQGQDAQAQLALARLQDLQPVPPLFDFDRGREALNAGDYQQATALFARELRRQPYQPEVHFWAAVAHWRLGERQQADEHLRKAVENSISLSSHALYAAKLAALRAHQLQ
jgi:tetratricopeptide (TPR) repeat protein